MFNIIELNLDNVWEYSTYIGDDMTEEAGRTFYRGLIALNDKRKPLSGIIWKLTGLKKSSDVKSIIVWFRAEDDNAAKEVFAEYERRIDMEAVMKTSFVIPARKYSLEKQILKDLGFGVRLTEGDDVVVSLKELTKIPLIKNRSSSMENVKPIREMTLRSFRRVIGRCISIGRTGICEDLEYLPMAYFDLDVSSFVEGADDINGIMLFHVKPSGIISVALMTAFDQDFSKTIPGMMRYFVASCNLKYSEDTLIHISRHNQATFLLAEKLLPRGFGSPVYAGERMEY